MFEVGPRALLFEVGQQLKAELHAEAQEFVPEPRRGVHFRPC